MNPSPNLRPAIFFDKDGTLVENVPYNVDCARLRLAAGAGQAARLLHEAGYALVVVTNQSGVARGLFTIAELRRLEGHLRQSLADEGAPLAGFYFCPHTPDGVVASYTRACQCRKPLPGMLLQAARELQLDLARSWLIGDLLDDVEAAHRAGCRAVLVDSGGETLWQRGVWRVPEMTVTRLRDAAVRILATGNQAEPYCSGVETQS